MAMQTEEDHAAHAAVAGGPETPTATHEGTTAPAGEHESSGLPQFDFAQWPGQILWFLIIFGTILIFMKLFAAPKVGNAIEERDAHISGALADARRMKDEADQKALAAQGEMAQARAAAQKVASDARGKANAEAAARLAEEEAKLAASNAEAEARIGKAREAAMANVATIASDTAGAIIQKLTGATATAAELAKAKG